MNGARERVIDHAVSRCTVPTTRRWAPSHPRASDRVTKAVLGSLLRRWQGGGFRIIYWDGTEERFGSGAPRFCLQIHGPHLVWRMLGAVDLGFGEGYMEGRVEVDDLDALLELAMSQQGIITPQFLRFLPHLDHHSIGRQYQDVQRHYDLGNDFFALWLDESRTYSCAYFEAADATLEEAQCAKRRHILRKLQLQPGQTLLDLGCGWGALLFDAAQQYGVRAHGITLSKQQYDHVRQRIHKLGLEGSVSVDLADYREFARSSARYDRVVSVGMFEHVGQRNLPVFLEAVAGLLEPGGLSLLHTITRAKEGPVGRWLTRYIFPGGYIPTWRETVWLMPQFDFELLDAENLRHHYAMTLDRWFQRFEARLPEMRALGDDERFIRMWRLYLRGAAAGFRYGDLSIHQFLFSKGRTSALPLTRAHLYVGAPAGRSSDAEKRLSH
jgi:cyclopropane-fatty-acyl-phospholipid synthase